MDRPTKVIETPIDKHKVEIKTYASGGEMEEIQGIFLDSMEMEVKPTLKGSASPKLKGSLVSKANHKALEMLIVSIDGSKENILQNALDMRSKDYQFIVDEINKITNLGEKKSSETKK
jgi:ATP-dependent protease HslVU (ClpYQ) ATPase subunit